MGKPRTRLWFGKTKNWVHQIGVPVFWDPIFIRLLELGVYLYIILVYPVFETRFLSGYWNLVYIYIITVIFFFNIYIY
jgi:hypothetical protein